MKHQARKRFGQNFLVDQSIIEQICQAFAGPAAAPILEIGPGLGALTERLLSLTQALTVIEIDRDLVAKLKARFSEPDQLQIICADVLTIDFAGLGTPSQPWRVIGNLPYNISTPLLFHLLAYPGLFADLLFMLQKELVQRLTAQPGSKAYGRLSVMVQQACAVEALFDVPPHAFSPAPKVMSAMVRLQPLVKPLYPVHCQKTFADLVRLGFNQRRKTIGKSLAAMVDKPVLLAVDIDASSRAEQLSVEQWVRLANRLS